MPANPKNLPQLGDEVYVLLAASEQHRRGKYRCRIVEITQTKERSLTHLNEHSRSTLYRLQVLGPASDVRHSLKQMKGKPHLHPSNEGYVQAYGDEILLATQQTDII